MRRSEREITSRAEIDEIIRTARVCRLGMVDDGVPYVLPISFGYDGQSLYMHSAPAGRKIEVLRKNPQVCFELDLDCEVVPAEQACHWGTRFRSVVGFGRAQFVEDLVGKQQALQVIMGQYADAGQAFSFPASEVGKTVVIRVVIDSVTGKKSGY